eukprot:COSAG02_NODE_1949_length_10291_cov_176.843505_5_plen_147_part_00
MVSCMCAHSQRAQCPVVENYFTGKTSAQFFVASRLSLHRALWYLRKRCFHLHAIRRIYSKPTHQVRSARTPVRSSDFVRNCVDLCGIVQVSNRTEKSGRRQDSLQHAPVVAATGMSPRRVLATSCMHVQTVRGHQTGTDKHNCYPI